MEAPWDEDSWWVAVVLIPAPFFIWINFQRPRMFKNVLDKAVKIRFSRFNGNIQLELCEQCILQIRTWYEGINPKGALHYLQVSEIYCSHILRGYSSNWTFKQMKYTNGKKWETCSYHWYDFSENEKYVVTIGCSWQVLWI